MKVRVCDSCYEQAVAILHKKQLAAGLAGEESWRPGGKNGRNYMGLKMRLFLHVDSNLPHLFQVLHCR